MADIKDLKSKTRLEELIEETGYRLDQKTGERYLRSSSTPGLQVDLERQVYTWGAENGDAIA